MRLLTVFTVAVAMVTGSPAAASVSGDERLDAVGAALDAWCAKGSVDPPYALLLAAADGRSADEFALALRSEPIRCLYSVRARGAGDDEIAAVGLGRVGVVLWVDRGWWRVASVGRWLEPEIIAARPVTSGQEVLIGLCGCGSGGNSGIVALRLAGPRASVLFSFTPGASQMGARFLDEDHVLVEGRKLTDRPFAWPQNCCLPGGHEWLFERANGVMAVVAERQSIDPYYVLSAYMGALRVGSAVGLDDVATPEAVDDARSILRAGPIQTGTPLGGDVYRLGLEEQLRWEAVPGALRSTATTEIVFAPLSLYGSNVLTRRGFTTVVATMERGPIGWRVSRFEVGTETRTLR